VRKELIDLEWSALEYSRDRKAHDQGQREVLSVGLERAVRRAYKEGATQEEIKAALDRGDECAKQRRIVD